METHVLASNFTPPHASLTLDPHYITIGLSTDLPKLHRRCSTILQTLARQRGILSVLYATSVEYPGPQLAEPTSKHSRPNIFGSSEQPAGTTLMVARPSWQGLPGDELSLNQSQPTKMTNLQSRSLFVGFVAACRVDNVSSGPLP